MPKLPSAHPGQVLREEFLVPLDLPAHAIAIAIDVPRERIERLAQEEIDLDTDTALGLARFFGTTPAFWMNLQTQFDLERAADDTHA